MALSFSIFELHSLTKLLSFSPQLPPLYKAHTFTSVSIPNHVRRPIGTVAQSNKSQNNVVAQSTKSQNGNVKKVESASNSQKKKRKKKKNENLDNLRDVEIVERGSVDDAADDQNGGDAKSVPFLHQSMPLPKPPAGFVVDEAGRVLMASNKRLATIVDPSNNSPLECVIRRVFRNSKGDECLLLCPVDTPVQILKSTNVEGWSAVSDEEVEGILPAVAYALAKIHMHLVHSGFCYTARGGFCYSEDNIFDFRTDDGQDIDGMPNEGVEITCFHLDGAHFMIYTPSDPLLFVAVKDQNGELHILDDDLLEDPSIISTIDEETEFNALVEEEAALLESLLGER
ncbi:hypothetical protein K2173_008698 [Erythroxylum novogranatense]|uniref:BTB/POZ domain-containing protein TNFAIP1 n=1 Tax=Erythroxylum novogranatense TaxID=1862640 RepID=A0AAV8SLM8_9ROSI|nr:hypothetical protein K2173_008698 [Erythroxylum novogranatense]